MGSAPEHAPAPSPLHHEYLAASRRAATVRQRNWVIGSSIVAAVAIGLSILAYWQRNVAVAQRTEATARRLSAEAQVTLSDTLARGETAVRNLLVSLALAPAVDARQALASGTNRLAPKLVGELPWPEGVKAPMGDPTLADDPSLVFSDDGAWIGAVVDGEALFWSIPSRKLERRFKIPETRASATLRFVPGRPLALIAQSPEGSIVPNAWTLIDLIGADVRALKSPETLDARIVGSTIWMLAKGTDGRVSAVDLADGKTVAVVPSVPAGRTLAFGRIVEPQADPITALATGVSSSGPAMVLIDDKGSGTLISVPQGTPTAFQLPAGAEPIALGAVGPALAIRTTGANDQAINLPSGEPVWQAAGPDAHALGFAGDGRFLVVAAGGGMRLETLGGAGLLVENSRRTDYDINALNDLSRYTPIVSAGVAAQNPKEIVTALKDGRITVWNATARPRFGATGAMPSPIFRALRASITARNSGRSWAGFSFRRCSCRRAGAMSRRKALGSGPTRSEASWAWTRSFASGTGIAKAKSPAFAPEVR